MRNVSHERAERLAVVVGSDDRLSAFASSDVYWDEIISIEPDGEVEVFDLTIPGLHNFVANDVILHNSIEQDADVVAFIYREELYNQTEENRGEAELIVSKQRNGPTGKVELAFINQWTRFENKWRESY
jgi:replicative DNA helicase